MKNSEEEWKEKIEQNRPKLDDFDFNPAESWEKLEYKRKHSKPSRSLKPLLRIAAVFVGISIVGLAYFVGLRQGRGDEAVAGSQLPAEVREAQVYYATQVNQKLEEARKYEGGAEIGKELQQLQDEYLKLEKEMAKPVNRQEVLNAMIENYKLRLSLLESFLQEMKVENKTGHENTSI